MASLRRISTRRLLLLCAAVLTVAAAGTALALAGSGGPVPPRKPLANAIHGALVAQEPQGVTARIEFTNNLLDGIDLRGANPLLSGATGRLWATNDGRFRLELQASGGGNDAQIVSDGTSWWAYDGSSDTVYRGTVPKHERTRAHHEQVPSVSRIQRVIDHVMRHAAIAGPTPTNIAGQAAYDLRTSPRRDGGLLGALDFAWDASHGTPLRGGVYARGQSDPVLELRATEVSFGPVAASTFDIPAPSAAHTQHVAPPRERGHAGRRHGAPVTGLTRVQRRAGFTVSAPATLAGRKRRQVALVGHGRAVLVGYGRGLSGVAVIEQRVTPGTPERGPLARAELPTVSIGGISAQELSTPLGTALRFQRGGIRYTVLASAPHAVVETAARGL